MIELVDRIRYCLESYRILKETRSLERPLRRPPERKMPRMGRPWRKTNMLVRRLMRRPPGLRLP